MFIILTLSLFATVTFELADIVRLVNVNLEKKGIQLSYGYVPCGLQKKPFIIQFRKLLRKYSLKQINVDAINTFIMGNYDKCGKTSPFPDVTNMLDPFNTFKDAWFGVYFIFDDTSNQGKKFMLKDTTAPPHELTNINIKSLIKLTELDQMMVVYSTNQGNKQFYAFHFMRNFPFIPLSEDKPKSSIFTDKQKRKWVTIYGEYETIAALTNIKITNMRRFKSVRAYFGIPVSHIYTYVDPWHKIILKGKIFARYFNCTQNRFWAIVYFNSSSFQRKDGRYIDNWKDSGIQKEFYQMLNHLQIKCVQK